MDRDSLKDGIDKGFGSPEYAREELRAEISAMMTGEQVGVGHDPQRGAAYVENWVAVLEEDPYEIQRAARDAEKMTDFLIDRAITQEREQPTQTRAELTHEYSHERGPQIGQKPERIGSCTARKDGRAGRGAEQVSGDSGCLIQETLQTIPGPGPRRSWFPPWTGAGRERIGAGADTVPSTTRGKAGRTSRPGCDRAVAEIGIYRSVAYKDMSEAHFDSHPYATRRAVDRMIQTRRCAGTDR